MTLTGCTGFLQFLSVASVVGRTTNQEMKKQFQWQYLDVWRSSVQLSTGLQRIKDNVILRSNNADIPNFRMDNTAHLHIRKKTETNKSLRISNANMLSNF